MFNKPLDELDFADIKKLKENKIPESSFVDYKKEMIEDKKLVKQICGFANTNGGYLIFGVEESDDEPPIPKNLLGLTLKDFNMQRTEQIINTNIVPRLLVEISPPVYKPKRKKCFVVIRIPEGPDKPYISKRTGRFYYRYNYETRRMTEPEISNMYRQRFSTPRRVREYIEETMSYHNDLVISLGDSDRSIIFGNILVFPPNVGRRRIAQVNDTVLSENPEEVSKIRDIYSSLPGWRSYNQFGIAWDDGHIPPKHRLEVHRNGLIHLGGKFGPFRDSRSNRFLQIEAFTEYALLTVMFSDWVYKQIEYFGPVTILFHVKNTKDVYIQTSDTDISIVSKSKEIRVEREWNSWQLGDNYAKIVKNMMDEFMNHFGHYKYGGFEEGGLFKNLLKNQD